MATAAKRKRASSPAIPSLKRQRRDTTRDSDDEEPTVSRATRRQTITAATPQRGLGTTPKFLQHAPLKKQYGKVAQRRRELHAQVESDSDSDIPKRPVRETRPENSEDIKENIFKILRREKVHVTAEESQATSSTTPARRLAKTKLSRATSGAIFDDDINTVVDRTPVLELPTPPTTASIKRMLRNQKLDMSENVSELGDTDAVTTEAEESQPTPCPSRPAKTLANSRRRQSEATVTDAGEVITPRTRRSFGKSAKKSHLDLGTFLDEQLRRASSANARKSLPASSLPPSSDDEPEATPTKPRGRGRPSITPKQLNKVSLNLVSSDGEDAEKKISVRPPARPKKARRSYNAKVNTPHKLDLTQADAVSVQDLKSAYGTIERSTPPPETDIEGSGTEGELTPASARAFNSSSSPLLPTATFEDDEVEEDENQKLVLEDVADDALPSQPASPIKSRLPKEVPGHLIEFFDAQKQLALQTIRAPPFIDVAPVVLGERAPVEASAYKQLSDLLKATCERGEANSCLLLGPRGSGKTLLFETVLKQCSSNPIVVRLSGHMQSTDRLAMREIAYQLNHQTETIFNIPEEEDVADPEQTAANVEDGVDFTPPAAYLPTLISQLTSLKRPVVVVLDGFDLFAAHPRQALLYCLLDTVQSSRVGEGRNGLLVVGVSCVVNCINLLEKRVKSRFSHRVLKVPNPATFEAYLDIAKQLLNTGVDTKELGKGKGKKAAHTEWTGLWMESVENFLTNKKTKSVLMEAYGLRRDIGSLSRLLLPVVQGLDQFNPWLSTSALETSETSQIPHQYAFMNRLPQAAMWVLVAIYHWGSAGHENINLKMILDACGKAATFQDGFRLVVSNAESRSVSSSVMAPGMLQAAFEELVRLKVLQAATGTSGSLSSEYIKYRCMVDRESLRKVVEKNGSTVVKDWLVSSGVLSKW